MKSFCTKKGNDIITTLVVYHSTFMTNSAGYDMIYRQGLPPPPSAKQITTIEMRKKLGQNYEITLFLCALTRR